VWDHKTLAEERGPRKDAGPLLNLALAKISVRRRQDGQRAALGLLVDALNSVRAMNRWNEVAIDSSVLQNRFCVPVVQRQRNAIVA
jgi:hypothetical protein